MRMTDAQLREFVARGQIAQAVVAAVATKGKRRRAHPEDDIQRAVCQFWELCYPQTWHMTFHPPNGLAAKTRALAAIFKGLGVKPGVPDLMCTARRGAYNGFALELKSATGTISNAQAEWQARLITEGWMVVTANSLDKALVAIRDYNELPARHARQ